MPASASMEKSLYTTYCHCRNPRSIYGHHRPTHYTKKKLTLMTTPSKK